MWQSWLRPPDDEVEAARIGMGKHLHTKMLYALRAGIALAFDPNDTRQVLFLTLALDYRRLCQLMQRVSAYSSWQRMLRERASIDTKHVDFAHLRALPADTLGGAYARMLERNQLDPDFFRPAPEWPADVGYLLQRVRQTHDVMHVLTGLETDIASEIALQAFVRVQVGMISSSAVVIFGLIIYALREPRMWPMVVDGYRAGSRAAELIAVRWEDYWELPLREVRALFNIMNLEHWRQHAGAPSSATPLVECSTGASSAEAA